MYSLPGDLGTRESSWHRGDGATSVLCSVEDFVLSKVAVGSIEGAKLVAQGFIGVADLPAAGLETVLSESIGTDICLQTSTVAVREDDQTRGYADTGVFEDMRILSKKS